VKHKPAKKKTAKAPKKKTAGNPTAPSKKVPTWIGKLEECAHELNLGSRRIQQLAREGLPKAERGVYDIIECLRWYVRYLQRKLIERALPEDGDGDGGAPATSSAARRHELLSIEAELKKIELAKEREQLVSIDKVSKDIAAIVVEIRTRILALPPRLAAEVLGETDLAIAQVKIDRSLKGALESLSQYDPDDDLVETSRVVSPI
jgi:phage terminase Nu1 subunit (DNA packaging protein)